MSVSPPSLEPLAFLIGSWRGEGVGGYPTIEDFRFGQEVTFEAYGKPVLAYTSRSWALDDSRPLSREAGFWRPTPDGVELLLVHASGFAELYLGTVSGTRVELATDVVVRAPSAKQVDAQHRMYGLVGDELMYVAEMAAVGRSMQPHLSARLRRVDP